MAKLAKIRKEGKTGENGETTGNLWGKLPEKAYLVERGWWDHWCHVHAFAKYTYLMHLH